MTEEGLIIKVKYITGVTSEIYPDWCNKYLNKYLRSVVWNERTNQFDIDLTDSLPNAKIFMDTPNGRKGAETVCSVLRSVSKNYDVKITKCTITILEK
jgi:hypothetical protein